MKTLACHLVTILLMVTTVNGQTAREIIDTAIEKTGGLSNWGALNGFRITAWFDQGGVDFPLEIVQLKDGRQYTKINFQETEIMQGVFDGETLWSTNFQTQTPEKADLETTANVKLDANDFPDDLLGYQRKNYTVELLGKTTLNSVPCFKIKLTKEPVTINGVKSDDLVYYYFNTSTFLPFAKEFEMKHGPIQGSTMLIQFEDYRQVDGLFFPFSMLQGVKDAPPQPLKVESIELNPDISQRVFIFSK